MNTKKYIITTIITIMFAISCQAKSSYKVSAQDKEIFDQYCKYIEPFSKENKNVILEKTALFFVNTPYVASTLEGSNLEQLTINLHELDCFTFVETVVALANSVQKDGGVDFDFFVENIKKIRYRDGVLSDYSSRLHYTSEWVSDNEKKGILKNISKEIGGVLETKTINFMSQNRDKYSSFKTDEQMFLKIKNMETNINRNGGFYFLPKKYIDAKSSQIPNMSIVGFCTSIKGLDTSHVGFAFKDCNNVLKFIHASSVLKKVVVSESTLSQYCLSKKMCTGILIIKVL